MDWLFIAFLSVFVLLILLIIIFLVLLAKQGDERYKYIKTKAMANTLNITVGILVLRLCYAIYEAETQANAAMENLSLLLTIAVIFLASLLWEKRKYGG